MPNNWRTYKLGELISYQKGFAFKSDWFKNKGELVVRVSDTTSNSINITSCHRIDKDKASELQRYKLDQDDIVIATVGSWPPNYASVVGKVIKVPSQASGALLNQNAVRLKSIDEKLHSKMYIYYLMKSDYFLKYIVNTAQGSANQASIKLTDIFDFEFDIPTIQEQQSISQILSAIDDKIENNLAINKTLEEMAMALYKHWFVDFGPFQDVEFVGSKLGLIPKGWEVKRIGELIETLGGGTPSTTTKEYWEDGDILWYSPTDLTRENSLFSFETAKKITPLGLQKSSAKMFPANSLLMSSRATIGLLTISTKEACTNQGFITMLPNEKLSVYQLYFWVKQNMELINSKCNGSTFKEISKSNFRDLYVLVANDIESYIEQSKDIFEKIKNNTSENQNLVQLRDTLLPKLISGEVRLKEFRE